MRWLLVLVASLGGPDAFACPRDSHPIIWIGGQHVGNGDHQIRHVPPNPRFYVRQAFGRIPTFQRSDGSPVPVIVEPTPLDGLVSLTVPMTEGDVLLDNDRRVLETIRIHQHASVTRNATREQRDGYDRWQIDSDATLFRIESGDDVDYSVGGSVLMVDPESTIVAIHGDGREELIYRREKSTTPWWMLALGFSALSLLALRRAERSLVG